MSSSSISKTLKSYLTLDNIIFVVIIGSIVLYVGLQSYVFHTSNPQVAVTTTSMVPTYQGYDLTQNYDYHPFQYYDILRGDLLLVQNKNPQVGDVVVFNATMSDGGKTINCMVPLNVRSDLCTTPIVHRLVAERIVNGQTEFATKGDHNPYTDAGDNRGNDFGWIYKSAILGVVIFAIHHIGWLSLQLQDNLVRVGLIAAIALILLLTIWDSIKPKKEEKKNKKSSEVSKKRVVFLKFKNFHLRINRSNLSLFIIFIVIFTSYFGIGMINTATNHNTVQWVPRGQDETNNIINLRTSSTNQPEKYGSIYMYNTLIRINSSGSLNFVNKLVITTVFNNFSSSKAAYVWTIVYDYAGSKLIHAVFIFNIPSDTTNMNISTTINYTLYSTGLLASAPFTMSQEVTVLT